MDISEIKDENHPICQYFKQAILDGKYGNSGELNYKKMLEDIQELFINGQEN